MKPTLTKKWCIGFAYAFILLSNLSNIPPVSTGISPVVERHLLGLSSAERSVKTVVDNHGRYVYWLSFIGEVHRIPFAGGPSERVVQSVGMARQAMFIEDFCLDQEDRLFFTDLMDQETGLSAIKQVDSSGHITTVATLREETPYQLRADRRTGQIHYLTKANHSFRKIYRVRTVGEDAPLASSFAKIDQLDEWIGSVPESATKPLTQAEEPLAASY